MAINAADVKLMRAERNTDESDGGGMMTGTPLVSGDINNLWPDISHNGQVRGGLDLRKVFGAVRSANADAFLGSGFMIVKDAVSDYISTMLFPTGSHYDERDQARELIEQFVVLGRRSALRPVGTQRIGQTAIVVYADRQTDAPAIGEVLFLISGDDEQPVKVIDVSVVSQSYTYVNEQGAFLEYNAYEMTLKISQPLQYEFRGSDPAPAVNHSTEIYKTQSNSNAKYYGIRPLAQAASVGDSSVFVDTIFQPIIPAATSEVALIDQIPGVVVKPVQPARGSSLTRSLGTLSGSKTITLPTAWVPGSMQISVASSEYVEDGDEVQLISGSNYLSEVSLSPASGLLQFTVSGSRSVTLEYVPGAAVELVPFTDSVEINQGNRQLTYTEQLVPAPYPGSLRIEFMYLGDWYTITDNGTGELSGPESSGTVNNTTGSASFTLPGEPDVGSHIIYTWASSPLRIANTGARSARFELQLPGRAVAGSAQVSWSRNSNDYTATADASDNLSGSAGRVVGDRVIFTPANLPTGDVTVNYTLHDGSVQTADISVAQRTGGSLTINVGQTNIQPGSLSFSLALSYETETLSGGTVYSTRIRKTVSLRGRSDGVLQTTSGLEVGTISAAAGDVTIDCDLFTRVVTDYVKISEVIGGWNETTVNKTMRVEAQTVTAEFLSSSSGVAASTVIPFADLSLLIDIDDDYVCPGSVLMTLNSLDIVDRGDGALYKSWSTSTAAGVTCGTIDYPGGRAEIIYSAVQSSVSSLSAEVISGVLGIASAVAVQSVKFRTNASPLRANGLQFTARRAEDGALIRAESDNAGIITGDFDTADQITQIPIIPFGSFAVPIIPNPSVPAASVTGSVDTAVGFVELEFDQPVLLTTLTYNAVAYKTVPQDPAILGADPVRLPTNGRVPVFQDGYLVAVHHTDTLTVASPVAAQVIDCGRTNLARVTIRDALGADLAASQYSVDLVAGTVTLADPFSAEDEQANSLTMPLTVSHRIMDRAVANNASITGELSLNLQLTHDFPAGDSYVSAVVETGDLQARVYNIFNQKVDQAGVFSDDLVGDQSVATYNDLEYPILIDNLGSVEDRWKLRFTSATAFECISEQRGVIGVGNVNTDFSPLNPMTETPFFTIRELGFGDSWISGNIFRFNTKACAAPTWLIRTNLPSNQPIDDDEILVEFMGSAD